MRETATDIRKITLSIARHYPLAMVAVGLTGAFAFFFPLFAYVSGALAGLVALERGLKKALIVTAGATLLAGLIALFGLSKAGVVFPLLLVLWFPNSICTWLLRETRSPA